MKFYRFVIPIVLIFILACSFPQPQSTAIPSETPTVTVALSTDTPVSTLTFTPTITETLIPSFTLTPSITPSLTITPTPTFVFPVVTVNQQAHCRYGPSGAYLHAADLYAGDVGTVRGRFAYSRWLYIKFDKLNYFCWAAPSVVDVVGDVSKINLTVPNLQSIGSNQYGPPQNVTAIREGNTVIVNWDQMVMTTDKDRGYFWELFVCQGGNYIWWTGSHPDQFSTSFSVKDEAGCSGPSLGFLYTVEKHGYSEPVTIPWPAP